jgi:hypothetical protein
VHYARRRLAGGVRAFHSPLQLNITVAYGLIVGAVFLAPVLRQATRVANLPKGVATVSSEVGFKNPSIAQ